MRILLAAVLAALAAATAGCGSDHSEHEETARAPAVSPTPAAAEEHGGVQGEEEHGAQEPPAHGGDGHGHDGGGENAVLGLRAMADGYSLELSEPRLARSGGELAFRIVHGGEALTDYEVEHQKRMHVIVVRRDLTNFQHLHPGLGADGTWAVPVRFREPGEYRVFADFRAHGEKRVLGADLEVPGRYRPRALTTSSARARTSTGYEVVLKARDVVARQEAKLAFVITDGGRTVEAQPYLGARGHLVALRSEDLAYLHVHPEEETTGFHATFPSSGTYRLFLQFRAGGRVHTAAFTMNVAG